MNSAFEIELVDRMLVVRFSRPQLRNPLSIDVIAALHSTIDDLQLNSGIRTLSYRAGDTFASGADLREIANLDGNRARKFAETGQALMLKISNLPINTVAAINGYCFGGGLDLALSCKHRIASPTAVFSHPGVSLGIITGWGGTQRLPRLVGDAAALEMLLTAKRFSADEALRIGLVDQIADDVLSAALDWTCI